MPPALTLVLTFMASSPPSWGCAGKAVSISSGEMRVQQPTPSRRDADRPASNLGGALLPQRDHRGLFAGGLFHAFLQGAELALARRRGLQIGADLDQLAGAAGGFGQEIDLVAGAGRDIAQRPP